VKRLISLIVVSFLIALAVPVAAHDATPEASDSVLAQLGYPELAIQARDGEIEVPNQVDAGRTLIAYENVGQESSHPILIQIPDEVGVDEAVADLGPEATEPPSWFFDGTFPGFVGETLPGETSRAIVDLTPGHYLVLDDAAWAFEVLASDATPVAARVPETNGTVRLFEMGFEFPDSIEPGRQVWEITNDGAVPHELLLVWSPQPVTAEQALALILSEDSNATPVGGGPSSDEIVPVGGIGWLSPGITAWTEVDLDPGTYIAVCFVFDPETGLPHAMLGMIDVFSVGEQ